MLKGPDFHLRTVRTADLDQLYDLACDVGIRGPYFPLSIESESAFHERFSKTGFWTDERGFMLIVENGTNRLLGSLVFFPPSPYYNALELGYIIYDAKDRGRGITSTAVKMLSKYLFDGKLIHRLQLQLQPGNTASRRVAEKCGFKLEGVARHALIVNGRPTDLEVYGLTREDFEALG